MYMCEYVYDIMYNVRVCVREKEGEKERREDPKGMEKPIPSYQRKWLLADRKKRCAFSAEDDNNKHLRSASFKLERESFFYNQPLTHAIFQYPASFIHVLDYGSPWLTFVSMRIVVCNAARKMSFFGIFSEIFSKIDRRLGFFKFIRKKLQSYTRPEGKKRNCPRFRLLQH